MYIRDRCHLPKFYAVSPTYTSVDQLQNVAHHSSLWVLSLPRWWSFRVYISGMWYLYVRTARQISKFRKDPMHPLLCFSETKVIIHQTTQCHKLENCYQYVADICVMWLCILTNQPNVAQFFLRSKQVLRQSRNSPNFMEAGSSLPHSQKRFTCPYPEPDQSSPLPAPILNICFNIIPTSTPISSKWSPFLRFPHHYPVFTCPLPTTCFKQAHLVRRDLIPYSSI